MINVIGAGLAGCEAAWQAAKRGCEVRLIEMKPHKFTPAHHSEGFAELVCSNSLRSNQLENAVGLLKEEMRLLGSLIIESAYANIVPAGSALAVDRTAFSEYITEKIKNHPLIHVEQREITDLGEFSDEITVVATGPLTSDALFDNLKQLLGLEYLSFFDAAAPIVEFSSIDTEKAFFASRYDKGDADYINCPMTKEQYEAFYNELINAQTAQLKDFDNKVFEGCMPVEVMAKRGIETLLFGPLKPVGLIDPKTGKEAYATVQLRCDNKAKTMYNIVGFQTHLTFGEQKRVFSMIPGLENANFLRYGVMHRNTFINSPKLMSHFYSLKNNPRLFFAGQMTGVEGYVESASSGLMAGINAACLENGQPQTAFGNMTAIGALAEYICDESVREFQPMNVNFGIMALPETKIRGGKKAKNAYLAERALNIIRSYADENNC
ncbi:MAG: methylenetetrahydrofolate--tRNA-(uracil(54)-C(5))-methyltransferase (FADH(2)-oxidizing) TrmFO [Ruminococcaceae bacterium]|nr:methylenetetrahydrofolate--tRNA-(uracil(54)-C(5))-methyltransferase (FADH(2)-oxidizing) TrmFO [Oscillospiraceae bacterium]